ncbi:TorF family putative porin [Roseomonas sp. SSH11]|uniref:TorF family putative porin n=1 Tax=Pararoseomonas baculiformis TaxID=2820812 RepID=A0ABS4AG54_9PROT|nr:TorF family putative porin [Pararoseomonas baculiformis]MBP0445510.1 TorF family putative porin [Pararoseomonas baculiformis]
MKNNVVAAATFALGLSLAGGTAGAFEIEGTGLTIGITPTISSDYLFRGVSQTQNRGAVQGTVDIQHSTGFYVGAFVSNVTFLGTNARQEIDALAGWRTTLGGVSLDLGGIAYTYPGYRNPEGSGLYDLQYYELAVKASYEIPSLPVPVKVLGAFNWSPNYQLETGNGYYLEGGVEIGLPYDLTLGGRFGYQWIQNNPRWGSPDFANWNVTLSYKFSDFVLTAGYFDTDLNRRECFAGQKICDARGMVYLSRTF